ncbi:hypothetical protein DFH09DRAFT_1356468 [Mycena vulgaris]|nr:hypothetical protein DFH09DRAFT_1356468 [Mycena vulgaris]
MPDVPQELVEAIIHEVADPTTLAACALTSTASVTSSQRRLFQGKSIGPTGDDYEYAALMLTSSPHLGEYIRYLALDIRDVPANCVPLKAILPQIPNIERLSIVGNADPMAPMGHLGNNPCLIDLLSRPSLKCFGLQYHHLLPSTLLLRALSSVEEVVLTHLYIHENHSPQEMPSPGHLRHLTVMTDQYKSIVPFVLHPDRLRYLRQLERLAFVYPPVPEPLHDALKRLLDACSSTLKHLELELEAPLELPALPALHSLELWIDLDLVKTPTVLASIVSETIVALPHLKVLTISLLDRPKKLPLEPYQWKAGRAWDWVDLDSTFVDAPELCEVRFTLRYFRSSEPKRAAGFVGFIREKLPRTMNAGLLSFFQRQAVSHPMECFGKDS